MLRRFELAGGVQGDSVGEEVCRQHDANCHVAVTHSVVKKGRFSKHYLIHIHGLGSL